MTIPKHYISVTSKVEDFKKYLRSTNRAILSARFGDGKSTFLREFTEKTKGQYIFFTLNPLHYQVSDNKDIFEYVKRDLLMQMLSYTILEEAEYSNWLMLYSFVGSNQFAILEDIVDSVPDIDIPGMSTKTFSKPFSNLLKNIRKFRDYKKEIGEKSNAKTSENFISAFNKSKGSIYEFDAITQLLCCINKQIKQENKRKKIVLIVEDLDRIDPAHIFRILNILSAHIERYQPGVDEYEMTQGENKFMFDKILLVCDHRNIEHIFHHFYGHETDFNGYISKFSSHNPFEYSLKDGYKEFILAKFDKELMAFPLVMSVVADLIIKKSIDKGKSNNSIEHKDSSILRNIDNRLGANSLIREREIHIPNDDGSDSQYCIKTLNRLTKMLDILRRFSITFDQLWSGLTETAQIDELYKLVGICWLLNVNDKINIVYKTKEQRLERANKGFNNYFGISIIASEKNIITEIKASSLDLKYDKNGPKWCDNLPQIVVKMSNYLINNRTIPSVEK